MRNFLLILLLTQFLPDVHVIQGVTAGLFAGGLVGVLVWIIRNRNGPWLYGLPLAGWLAVVVSFYVLVFRHDAGFIVNLPFSMDFMYLSALVRMFGGIIVLGGSIGLVVGKIIVYRQERKIANNYIDADFDIPE
jgi:hypothetical protein